MNSMYKFTLKEGPKLQMKKKLGTKSWRNFLEGPKWKINIFIGTKNIFKYRRLMVIDIIDDMS